MTKSRRDVPTTHEPTTDAASLEASGPAAVESADDRRGDAQDPTTETRSRPKLRLPFRG